MSKYCLSFKNYFTELRKIKGNDFFSKIEDELGVNPETVADTPKSVSNLKLGKYYYNNLIIDIVRLVKDGEGKISGAFVKIMNKDREYIKDKKDRMIRIRNNDDNGEEFFLKLDDLYKMINQGMGNNMGQTGQPEMGASPFG